MKKVVSILALTILLMNSTYSQTESLFMSPIELRIAFTNESPLLQWDSWEEVNTSYYLIEKQVGAEPFTPIATIKAGGSTYGLKQYQFEDFDMDTTAPANYRLTLVWMDGSRKSWTLNQDLTAGN
ncbi:MAG: hypothetical protein ACPGRC_04230 [Salibacteraceae bacterium]